MLLLCTVFSVSEDVRFEAIEDFLTRGLQAYDVENDPGGQGEADGDLFTDAIDEQQDPAALTDEHGDEPTF